ncbi:hypothetical protein [Nannocystis sp.]|uniref:hypothetical protein n=1 Tax=Nannocystis sp. TaxID=1962667 RepID=UPI0025FF534F|nr:hypothetical protein [Nannocystis sp.]
MFAVAVVGIGVTGPTVSAAERAVLVLAALDLVIAVTTIVRFVAASAAFSAGFGRLVWVIVCVALPAVGTAAMFSASAVALDR